MSAPGKEDQLRRILYELQLMEGTANLLQQRLQLLNGAITELRVSQQSLTDMKELKPDTPILVPVGGGALIRAKAGSLEKVILSVGAGVSVEMELSKALEDVAKRLEEVEKSATAAEDQLSQVVAQMQAHQETGNRLQGELQGEATSVR